ncbi:uncharacterized protein LOC128266855 [Anopheles cruzii]|uniref:uncharacterized protein LOC128266855 n=1 Tax=Anopheles cruzii TaxID=68878 RepID=UPI0022EC57AA|nr:uncharacterized protein LOC128266855 [Anopheles cruzii]
MTMSHLLKQTKKCCVKIIRKLSLNSSTTGGGGATSGGGDDDQSPTAGGVGLNNRITAKYVLHKNCTPTRCKIQPGCLEGGTNTTTNSSFDELRHSTFGWSASSGLEHHHHHHPPHDGGGFHPLAEEQSIAGESLSFRRSYSGSDDNIPETQNNYSAARNAKNLPKKRTNITSNKNVNLRKCFRLRSKTFDTTPSVGTAGPPVVAAAAGVTQEVTAPVQPSAAVPAADVELPDSQTLANNNSSSRLIGARLDKISKSLMRGVDVGGGPEEQHHHHHGGGLAKISKPLFLTSKKHRRSNYNHIDAADDDDDENECEEVVTVEELGGEVTTEGGDGRWRRSYHQAQAQEAITLTSSALMFSAGDRQPQPQFRPQQEQETTLTTPAVANQYHHHQNGGPSVLERLTVAETAAAILFEKVKYDRTKRYLIDQLTEAESTSLSGGPGSPASLAFQGLSSSCSSSPFHLAVAAAAAKSEDFVDPWRNYNIRGGTSWDKVSKSPWDSSASVKASPVAHSTPPAPPASQQPVSAHPVQSSYTPIRSHWNPFEYSPAHLARLATTGSSQQQQHLPPSAGVVVEPKHPQYRPAFQVQTDVWENLNNKHYEIDTDVVWRSTRCSSRRTSASTVETWIDDETFDNSFNEELERRCATLQICE